jgi:hypothetical protein
LEPAIKGEQNQLQYPPTSRTLSISISTICANAGSHFSEFSIHLVHCRSAGESRGSLALGFQPTDRRERKVGFSDMDLNVLDSHWLSRSSRLVRVSNVTVVGGV